jgi:hypothetical protein
LNFDYTAYTPLRVYDWPHETTLKIWLEIDAA